MQKNWRHLILLIVGFMITAVTDMKGDTVAGKQLLKLARSHFKNDLWFAEEAMFRNRGTVDCTPTNINNECDAKNETDPDHAASWSTNRKIRADRLTWLCTDFDALKLISDDGIQITGARIISNSGETNTLNFEKACFPVRMEECKIEAVLNVNNAHLSCLDLNGTHITQEIYAYQVTVDHDVALGYGFKADGQVIFYVAHIGGDFDCSGGRFCNPHTNSEPFALAVMGTKIAGYAYLCVCPTGQKFEADGEVIFRNSSVDNEFVWLASTNADKTILDLSWLKVQRFKDDEKSWPKANNLYLDGFTYDEIVGPNDSINLSNRIAWLRLQPTNRFYAQPYQQLATVLRERGDEDDANAVMIEKNVAQSHFTKFLSSSWWWYNVFGKPIGYGYRPMRAIWASVVFIFAGWIFSSFRLFSPTDKDKASVNGSAVLDKDYPKFSRFIYSLETFIPFLKLGVADYWHPTGGALRVYFWIHIIIGWILTTLLAGALTGLIKT
jgi:hypothetical protein